MISLRDIALSLAATSFLQMSWGQSERSSGVVTEPVPEPAFLATAPSPQSLQEVPGSIGVASPSLNSESAVPDSFTLSNTEPPFYRRWLDTLFDLMAPGDPYSRDKLVFILGTSVGYDTNVLYSAVDPIASATYGVNGAIDYHFGTRRLKIDAKLTGGINYYENRPGGSDDQNYGLRMSVDYQLMPRLGLSFNTYTAYLSQPSPQLIGGLLQYSGSYLYTDTGFGVEYQARPRLSVSFGYQFSGFKYEDELINQSSGYYQQNISLSGNWLFSPRTSFVLQYRFNPITYYESDQASTGNLLLVGINQALSPRLSYSLLGGAEYRDFENPGPEENPSYLGPFVEGSVNYSISPDSEIIGRMRYGTEPSGGGAVRQTFRASVEGNQKFGSRFSVGGSVSYERDDYGEGSFIQDLYTLGVSFRYQFALATSLVLSETYYYVGGSTPNSSYTRNYVSLGLEVTF